jgi:hypothetical protein
VGIRKAQHVARRHPCADLSRKEIDSPASRPQRSHRLLARRKIARIWWPARPNVNETIP